MTTNTSSELSEDHVFAPSSRTLAPAVVSVEEKMRLAQFVSGNYIFYRLPADEEWVRREGWDMSHCLATCQKDYCRRMRAGEIEVWSMTDVGSNTPVVDIEVALTRSSYGGDVPRPTVSQIRGVANQCPPKDDFLPHIVAFMESPIGSGWDVCGHGVRNFDSRNDGDLVMRRWASISCDGIHTSAQQNDINDK
jgi:hypothetical protein